jgi:hypothetical protein
MIVCYGFLFFMVCNPPQQTPIDSYCQTYIKVIQAKGDGAIQATQGVKRRLLANERTYSKTCSATSPNQ